MSTFDPAQIPDVAVEESMLTPILKYGVVGIGLIVFALVIRYLYKESREDRKKFEEERGKLADERERLKADNLRCIEQCKTEKEGMRVDFERQHRIAADEYARLIAIERDNARRREDDIRRETMQLVEKISQSAQVSSEALVEMLQKFYEKIVK
jgi:hypothetical protein